MAHRLLTRLSGGPFAYLTTLILSQIARFVKIQYIYDSKKPGTMARLRRLRRSPAAMRLPLPRREMLPRNSPHVHLGRLRTALGRRQGQRGAARRARLAIG